MSNFKPDYLIIHCTATTPSMTNVDASWVDRLHRKKGWLRCGYHEVITRSGERQNHAGGYRTRPITQAGAHVGGCGPKWNQRTIGVSLAGGVAADGRTPEDNFTPAQMLALEQAVAEYTRRFEIPWENVIGHRDLIKRTRSAPKACPCFSVQAWVQQIDLGEYDDDQRLDYDPTQLAPTSDPLRVPETYTVKPGDTLWAISNTYGVPLWDLRQLNGVDDLITPGQELRLQ